MIEERPAAQPFDSRRLEMAALGFVITWPEKFYEVEDLKPSHFENSLCQRVFACLKDKFAAEGVAPLQTPVMIAKAMTDAGIPEADAFAFITECADYTPSAPDGIGPIRDELRKIALRRSLVSVALKLRALSADSDAPLEDMADQAGALIHDAVSASSTVMVCDMRLEMEEEAERMTRAEHEDLHEGRSHSTGLSALDHILTGLYDGEMIVIGARPSMGKSALLGGIIHSFLKQELPGLVFSMEMHRSEYAMRMICHTAGIDIQKARTRLLSPSERERYVESAKGWSGTPWYMLDASNVSIGQIGAVSRRLRHEAGIGWVAIDFLQLMDHNQARGESMNAALGRTSRGVKNLATALDLPVIALAQLNRECDSRPDKRPRLSDLRDSGSIEQDADVVMFLYRSAHYWDAAKHEEHQNDLYQDAEIIVRKQRNGPVGTARVAFYKESARFADVPDDYAAGPRMW